MLLNSIKSTNTIKQIVLVGNPNVGKSALFSVLTGIHADVSNYPGTTIDIARGKLKQNDIADTPGIYGISSFNDEERIASKMILEADIVINVVSALSLERDLFLTLQLADMGKPMILVLNQHDEAEDRGIKINYLNLAKELNIPIICTVAITGSGVSQIVDEIENARPATSSNFVEKYVSPLIDNGTTREQALLICEGDKEIALANNISSHSYCTEIYKERRQRVNELYELVVENTKTNKRIAKSIGNLLLNPLWGSLIALTICYLIFYQLLGVLVAGKIVDLTEKQGLKVYYEPNIRLFTANIFPCTIKIQNKIFNFPSGMQANAELAKEFNSYSSKIPADEIEFNFWPKANIFAVIGNCLVGEYGILTLTTTYLIGLLLPLVLAFYFALSILEDSGYLPRLAVLVDRLLNRLGLSGRAIIPMILGLGCVTMATVTTRLLSTKREKIIATALLGLAIPCSAQLGIVSGTLAKAEGVLPWLIYGSVISLILIFTGLVLNKILPGKSGTLIIDLPPMRFPRASNVLKKTWTKSWNFMLESIPMFALAGLVVSIGQMTGLLDFLINLLNPITVGLLKLPEDPRIATTFILGIVRRDFAAFGLTDINLTQSQSVVAMVVITLFVPCIATVGIMIKERGLKIALTIWASSWIFAFSIGAFLALILPTIFNFFS